MLVGTPCSPICTPLRYSLLPPSFFSRCSTFLCPPFLSLHLVLLWVSCSSLDSCVPRHPHSFFGQRATARPVLSMARSLPLAAHRHAATRRRIAFQFKCTVRSKGSGCTKNERRHDTDTHSADLVYQGVAQSKADVMGARGVYRGDVAWAVSQRSMRMNGACSCCCCRHCV